MKNNNIKLDENKKVSVFEKTPKISPYYYDAEKRLIVKS